MPSAGHWETVAEFLLETVNGAPEVARRLARGEVLLGDGTVVTERTAYAPGQWIYLHRDPPTEAPVPGEVIVLHEDDALLVIDKPPFLATMPRGRHVRETVLARLRRQPGWDQVQPAHRLDRLTAGVLLLTKEPRLRGAYQDLFAKRAVDKVYLAVVEAAADTALPGVVRSRIEKPRGQLQAVEVPGEVNAVTRLEVVERWVEDPAGPGPVGRALVGPGPVGAGPVGRALVRLRPETGRTHQLRVHLAGVGAPIVGDPLYPVVRDVAPDDFSAPLQLLASALAFTDPLDGQRRVFTSGRRLSVAVRRS